MTRPQERGKNRFYEIKFDTYTVIIKKKCLDSHLTYNEILKPHTSR